MQSIESTLTAEFSLAKGVAIRIIALLDDGATVPFIARYRKEVTGSMDDQLLRAFADRLTYLRTLEQRKEDILRRIAALGKLTDVLESSIRAAQTLQEAEQLYRPYQQKKRTRAQAAEEKGLLPLAQRLMRQSPADQDLARLAAPYVRAEKGVPSTAEALTGAADILAAQMADDPTARSGVRRIFSKTGVLRAKAKTKEDSVYRTYYDYREPISRIPAHRILAIFRGEREGMLSVTLEVDDSAALDLLKRKFLKPQKCPAQEIVFRALEDGYRRLLAPSLENEIRSRLREEAQEQAISVFRQNLRQLLLQPPLRGQTILGLDPAFRTGCKLAVIDPTGRLLDTAVIYPTPPQNKREEAKKTLLHLIERYRIGVIAIGNGTASRESEQFVAACLRESSRSVSYAIVDEAGASVYSASPLAAKEFPEYDVSLRSAVSIARRLLDPLSELCKIDPKSIGVGQYQHDVNQKRLGDTLAAVVEDCVNRVGVNVQTASVSLLSYVAGLTPALAENIVRYRQENGGFRSRAELLHVPRLGAKAFEQCAGFLRIPNAENVLDETAVHPESYPAALKLLASMGYQPNDVRGGCPPSLRKQVEEAGPASIAQELGIGVPTLTDIVEELLRPGRDIRDSLPRPHLRSDVTDRSDLVSGMELRGTVRNVTDFGAFVDIGVHQDGLVHISQMADRFIRHPSEVVSTGDVVTVRILEVDEAKNRISLTMKAAEKNKPGGTL